MRIKAIKISNILGYDFLPDFESAPNTIEFKEDMNILIGSNGSGKSNLLEVIYKLLQGHFFKSYFVNDSALFSPLQKDKAIKTHADRRNQIANTLFRNFKHRDKSSHIEFEFIPDPGDIKNLIFIYNHWKELNELSKEYCDDLDFFQQKLELQENDIRQLKACKLKFLLNNTGSGQVAISLMTQLFKQDLFFYKYLVYFEQIQLLLELGNQYNGKEYELLKNSFALISSMRTYGNFFNSMSIATGISEQIKQASQSEATHSTKSYTGTDYIFRITNLRLSQELRRLRNLYGITEAINNINNEHSLFTKINSLIKSNLGFTLKLENFNEGNDTIMVRIYLDSEVINFTELSMGQKGIFYLLFAVYGYDLKDGLLIIDEPELHLHVTMQQKYLKLIQQVCKEANLQIIIATHSSVFVNEQTIKNTFRFFKADNHTVIISPLEISQSQKDLIKILTYTNSSRIFFSDNVVLVEGDSDEYFFRFFYDNYIKKKSSSDKTLEIIYIGGKGNYSKWNEFLTMFKINTYFIGDFDNIQEHNIVHKLGINSRNLKEDSKDYIIGKILKEKIIAKQTLDGKELLRQLDHIVSKKFELDELDKNNLYSLWIYLIEKQGLKKSHLVEYLKENGLYASIKTEIELLYDKNIFILTGGDLEDYLNISKDLTNVIHFCDLQFYEWIDNESKKGSVSKLSELEGIFDKILC